MNLINLREARAEGRRFMNAVDIAILKIERDGRELASPSAGSKETAACRRASLDLTRALADMRK